ncbi:MAG: hypothetical protein PHR92_05710 [Lachnospiraceae bacterium]|nr:hypothetical protein [Lachnospiraceae bacterium]
MDIQGLYNKDNKAAYAFLQKLESISAESDELYRYLPDFKNMLEEDSSYLRVRGFRMICAQAKWDQEKQIDVEYLAEHIWDSKPTAIRQKLAALHSLLLYR